MPCATTLYFDLETDAAIRRLWQVIEDAGLPSTMLNIGYRPHLTLAVCETLNLDSLRADLPELVASQPPIALTFSSLGVFPKAEGVVFLGVTVNQTLIDFHRKIWQVSEAHTTLPNAYYSPEIWVPHVTLGYGLVGDQIGQAVNVLLKTPLPVIGRATELVVTDVAPAGYIDLYASSLGKPAAS